MPTSSVGIFNGKVGQFLVAAVGHFYFAANKTVAHGDRAADGMVLALIAAFVLETLDGRLPPISASTRSPATTAPFMVVSPPDARVTVPSPVTWVLE